MDTEKIEKMAEVIKKCTVNVESEHAKDVAKSYIIYKFIDDQVTNLAWLPFVLSLAYVCYAGAQWIIAQI
jgi:hypothetical protein